MRSRSLILIALMMLIGAVGSVRSAPEEEESFGEKVKKFLAGPTPMPHRRHQATPTPTATPKPKASRAKRASAAASPNASPVASFSSAASESDSSSSSPVTPDDAPSVDTSVEPSLLPRRGRTQLSEPVRPISPAPHRKRVTSPAPRAKTKTPAPAASVVPTETPVPAPTVEISPTSPPTAKGTRLPNGTLFATEIAGYENYPANVRKILDLGLSLTTQNLAFKYGSADPANGGMDSSGFIQYVLSRSGVPNVPRDAREQYIWVRKAGTFQAVLSHSDHSFELEALKPGDLLFWAGTHQIDRDPGITRTMIYLGRETATSQRIMIGASDDRSYKGQTSFGVSIFDFRVSGAAKKLDDNPAPVFVGYSHIPGLSDN